MVEPPGFDHDQSKDDTDLVSEVENVTKDEPSKYEHEDVDPLKCQHDENYDIEDYNVNLPEFVSSRRDGQ